MKAKEAQKLKDEAGMAPCWLVWEAATDGERPYLVAVDTSEEQAARHVALKKEQARVLDKPPPQLRVEESWLDHLYGESMTLSFDEAKKMMRELLRAQVAELKTRLARAIEIGYRAIEIGYATLARPPTDVQRRDRLDELDELRKALSKDLSKDLS